MRKFRTSLFALLTALTCAGSAFALTPENFTAAAVGNKTWFAFSGDYINDILKDEKSLLGIVLSTSMPAAKKETLIKTVSDWDFRMGYDLKNKKPLNMVFAIEIIDEVNVQKSDEGISAPDFTLSAAPEGIKLTPVGEKDTEYGKLYMAQCERNNEVFLLGAFKNADLLNVMAAGCEAEPPLPPKTNGVIRTQGSLDSAELTQILSETDVPFNLTVPFQYEFGISSSENAFMGELWINTKEIMQSDAQLKDLMDIEPVNKPLLVGSGPLLSLFSFENPMFSSYNKKEVEKKLGAFIKAAGLSLSDMETLVKGRCTIALAGKSSTMFGAMPGFYVHLSGATNAVSNYIMKQVAPALFAQAGLKSEKFTDGAWQGLRSAKGSMFSAYAASSPKGLIVAFQDSSELKMEPETAPDLAPSLEAKNFFAFSIDFPQLTAKLKALEAQYGSMIYSNDEDKKKTKDAFEVLDTLGVFMMAIRSAEDADIGVFVNLEALKALLAKRMPQPAEPEVKPAPEPDEKPAPEPEEKPVPEPDEKPAPEPEVKPAPEPEPDKQSAKEAETKMEKELLTRILSQLKPIISDAAFDEGDDFVYADYDGKQISLEVDLEDHTAQAYCIMDLKDLKIGEDRAKRLVRTWLKDNPVGEEYDLSVVEKDSSDGTSFIWFSRDFPYNAETRDEDFATLIEEYLEKLDSFCDTLPNKK